MQDAVNGLLQWAATDPSHWAKVEHQTLAKSLGLIETSEDLTRKVNQPELAKMYETAKKLYDAYRAEKKSPLFLNGRAQPIFSYTTGEKADEDSIGTAKLYASQSMLKQTMTPMQMASQTWSKPLFTT